MKVLYHPDFPKDIKRFEAQYVRISERNGRQELEDSRREKGNGSNQ